MQCTLHGGTQNLVYYLTMSNACTQLLMKHHTILHVDEAETRQLEASQGSSFK